MKRSHILIGIVIVSVALLGLQEWSQSQPQNPQRSGVMRGSQRMGQPEQAPGRSDEGLSINWQLLKLTQEQKQQIQQLRRKFQLDTVTIRKELQSAGQDFQAEMLKAPVDRSKIDELLNNISHLKQQLSEVAVQNLLDIKGILSQDQLDTLIQSQQRIPGELQRLKLTSEQRSQLQALMRIMRFKNRTLSGELRDLKEELREMLLASDETDMEQLQQVQTAIAEKELALEKARINNLFQMREILTPEQQEQLKQFRAKRFPKAPAKQK